MKKSSFIFAGFSALAVLTSCSGSDKKVADFAQNFAQQAEAGNLDSVALVYPDVEYADELDLTFVADSLKVEKTDSDNEFRAYFGNGKSAVITLDKDGNMTVKETSGIFSYPEDTMKMARKSGAYKPGMSDKELAINMIYLDDMNSKLYEKAAAASRNSITFTGPTITKDAMFSMDEGRGYYTLKNNTDRDISADEYDVTWEYSYIGFGHEGSDLKIEKGKDIPAEGSVQLPFVFSGHGGAALKKINMKTLDRADFEKNYKYSGDEFAEYMKTADKSLANRKPLPNGPFAISGKLGGKYPVHIILDKGMKKGSYYYDKSGPNNTLNLEVKSFNRRTGKIILEETNDKGEVTGTFTGELTEKSFIGKMTAFSGVTYNFDLTVDK